LLGAAVPPTAVVCSSDSLALGAMTAATAARARLEVIGFDDTPVATALGLSSVRQPVVEAARHALALLVHQMDQLPDTGSEPMGRHHLLAPHLVLRDPTFTTTR
jgi:DNA-binding LacI/PurR family transcriptional regulator